MSPESLSVGAEDCKVENEEKKTCGVASERRGLTRNLIIFL